MLQKTRPARPKRKDRVNSDAHAIFSYLRPGQPIPSGRIERQLCKVKGIKEITVNHLSQTVKIRYDPHVVTIEKIRSIFKKFSSV